LDLPEAVGPIMTTTFGPSPFVEFEVTVLSDAIVKLFFHSTVLPLIPALNLGQNTQIIFLGFRV